MNRRITLDEDPSWVIHDDTKGSRSLDSDSIVSLKLLYVGFGGIYIAQISRTMSTRIYWGQDMPMDSGQIIAFKLEGDL